MERKRRKRTIPEDYSEKFDYAVFGERLGGLLERDRITQSDLAVELDVDTQTVYRWKHGYRKTPIDYNTIVKIASFFRVDEAYLYDPEHIHPSIAKVYDEALTAHMEQINDKYGLFVAFLVSCGIDCDIVPPGELLIINEYDKAVCQMNESRMAALKRKISLFVQMELLC